MISKTTPEFWRFVNSLPAEARRLADRSNAIWLKNPQHPSIRFKPLSGSLYSVRIGAHYRAIGQLKEGLMVWIWIGSHETYNNFRF